jgi:hypothetical protein
MMTGVLILFNFQPDFSADPIGSIARLSAALKESPD